MNVYLTLWHYVAFFIFFIIWLLGMAGAFKAEKASLKITIMSMTTLMVIVFAGAAVAIIDKYTKFASLHKLKNQRLLSIEKIVYSGMIKNDGDYTIGEVTFEIKLVNQAHLSGNSRPKSVKKTGGFLDLLQGKAGASKVQSIEEEFVIARNIKPGEVKSFRVNFDYPPYFKNVSYFTRLYML